MTALSPAPHEPIRHPEQIRLTADLEPEPLVQPDVLGFVGLEVAGIPGQVELLAVHGEHLRADAVTLQSGLDADRPEVNVWFRRITRRPRRHPPHRLRELRPNADIAVGAMASFRLHRS